MKPPLFIVGPPRSGTKILRDTLQVSSSITATEHNLNKIWDCRDFNFTHEEYPPSVLDHERKQTLRRKFEQEFNATETLPVEKNVHHSLRINFVSEVFPKAKFLFIYRHPLDSVCSIRERWRNPVEWKYFLKNKLTSLSPGDIFRFGFKNLKKYSKKLLSEKNSVDHWGPRPKNLEEVRNTSSLIETCAYQWQRCANGILRAVRDGNSLHYHTLHYEDLMRTPKSILPDLAQFIGRSEELPEFLEFGHQRFLTDRIGRRHQDLKEGELEKILPLIEEPMKSLGYSLQELRD